MKKNVKSKSSKLHPLVTIITVCKNSENTIRQTIESVINQSYKNIEYIIIDGVSTDKTLDIIKHYKKNLKYISEPDKGIYDAMNKGIKMAKGEIIGIINSDDWYEFNAVDTVIDAYKKNGEGIYYGILRYFRNENEVLLKRDHFTNLNEGMIQHPTCFVPKSIYKKVGYFDLQYRIASDYEFMLRAYKSGVKFIPLDFILANFRESGISKHLDYKRVCEMLSIQKRYNILTQSNYNLIIIKKRIAMFIDKIFLGKNK